MKMLSTVGAGCLVIESDQVLLVQPNYGPAKGQWMFPGGFINDNESPEDAALRELWEETGQVGKVIRPLCIRYRQAPTDIYWVFQVELTLNTPISVLTSELLDVRFWPVKEAIHSPLVRPMSRFFWSRPSLPHSAMCHSLAVTMTPIACSFLNPLTSIMRKSTTNETKGWHNEKVPPRRRGPSPLLPLLGNGHSRVFGHGL